MSEIKVINISGVDCYEIDGTAFLKLEAVARGLGFTQEKGGGVYVRWDRVEGYLAEFGFPHKWGKEDFIPENIFYRLAMKAKNETAERFQALVADEIIPSIRKHGGYIAGQEDMTDEELMARALLVADSKIQERDKLIAEQREQIEAMRPAQVFADAVSASEQSCLVGELAKILRQNGIATGQNRLFDWLRQNGYLIRRKGTGYNIPTQRAMELGLFEIKETATTHPDGHTTVNLTPKVTGKGQSYFVNKFLA